MKRLAGYFLCFVLLCIMFSTCYYLSYQSALRKFNKKAVERNAEFLQNLQEYQKQEELLLTKEPTKVVTDPSVVSADTLNQDKILPNSKYYLLTYELTTNELITEQLAPPSNLIGLTRAELIQLLAEYMQDVPLEESEKGLYAYEVLAFSKDEVILRKSYNRDLMPNKYYMVVEDGKIVVYYSDLKTVYEYTNIDALYLPEDTRNELMKGIYIKDTEELFTLLESFSS